MPYPSFKTSGLHYIMFVVFGLGIGIQLLSILLADVFSTEKLQFLALHSAIEMAGAIIAALIAYLLLRLNSINEGSSFNHQIAAALLVMSCLDGLHSMMSANQVFVWLHSMATALGGLLFALIWLPDSFSRNRLKYWPQAAMLMATIFGLYSIAYPDKIANMLVSGRFTQTAVLLNIAGGLFFLLASIRLLLTYRHLKKPEDLLFSFLCFILGIAAILFEHSSVWDLPWWGWHVQRLAGYAILLWLFVKTTNSIEEKTIQSAKVLQQQIEERKLADIESRIAAVAFESHECMMITDANSVIIRINHAFTDSTGYTAQDVVGKTPRMLQSGRHNADFYREMWETIRRTGMWHGEIWDRRKNGEIYPKWLTISTVKDSNGIVTNYVGSHIDITDRKLLEDELNRQAHIDFLTGVSNRRHFMELAEQELNRATRYANSLSIFMMDIDFFKQVNDTHGHKAGDAVLIKLAQVCCETLREVDVIGRIGGEEFAILLPETDMETAAEVAERLRVAITDTKVPLESGLPLRVTVSIGVVSLSSKEDNIDVLLNLADKALYEAKETGRNKVCVVGN